MRILTSLGLALFMVLFSLGVPLLGWGIADWQVYFNNPARLSFSISVVVIAFICGIGYLLLPFQYDLGKREGDKQKQVTRQSIVPLVTRIIWLCIFILSPFSDRHNFLEINILLIRIMGVMIYIAGFSWVIWSFLTLGKQHSGEVTVQKGHKLITKGPYKWVRNPMYLGLILFPLGIGLVFGSWIGITLPILLVFLFIWRIRDEEELMGKEFGDEWQKYSKHSWRLIPFIY
jgi:protein-S-isoprenylcysteine O-methyltransferase Ste14